MISDYAFHCPHCDAALKIQDNIVLKTVRTNGEEGKILMATTVGNYKYTHEPDISFDAGEVVEFRCPSCNKSLNSEEFDKYALLKMKVEETMEFEVLFSRQAGVQKTYLITEDGIETYIGNQ